MCFLFTCFISFSQNIIGEINDTEGNKIPLVGIQLLENQSNKIISFTQSDANGVFTIPTNSNNFPLRLKFQHLSFETQILEIKNSDKLLVVLNSKSNELKEIVIESKSYDVVKRGDTLSYNLKNLMDGSELKLKDFVNKLPGFAIDEDGKIRYNGVVIDHLLIDGNEFFENKHQIANENITAEMISKLELITNYKGLSNIKDFDNSGKLALNIGIKDKFKNALKGALTAEAGYDERYFFNAHVFNFGKKTLFSLVANTNNINQNVLTTKDYVEFRDATGKKIMNQDFSQNTSSNNTDLPSFLFARDDSKSRKLSNITLNVSHKFSSNEKIEFISVYNYLNQIQSNFVQQSFFDTIPNYVSRNRNLLGKSNYFSNTLKYEKKFGNNSYFNINSYSLFSKDIQNQNIESFLSSNFNSIFNKDNLDFKTSKFGINSKFKKPLNSKVLLELDTYFDFNQNKTNKFLYDSNTFNWLNTSDTELFQSTKFSNTDLGAQMSLKYKIKYGDFLFQTYTGLKQEKLNNNLEKLSDFKINDSYTSNENIVKLQFTSFIPGRKLNYGLGLKFDNVNHYYKKDEQKTINALLPNAYLAYNFSSKFLANLNYSSSLNGFNIYNFLSGNLVNDYRTFLGTSNIAPKLMLADSYSLGFSYNFVEENIFSSLSISKLTSRKSLQRAFLNTNNFAEEVFQFQDLNSSTSVMFSFNKKFYQIPYSVRLNSFVSSSNFNTDLNGLSTENTNNNFLIDLSLRSYYKNSFVNYNIGVNYLKNSNINKYVDQKVESKLELITPFIKFNGTLFDKKLIWNLETKYYIYEATSVYAKNIFDLGTKVQYNINDKIQIYLNAQNILNIRKNNTKNNFTSTAYYSEQIIMQTLSGFVNVGLIFSF